MKESLHFAGLRQHISAQCNSAPLAMMRSRGHGVTTTKGALPGSSERPPDARASVAGQHGESNSELGQADEALEGDIPSWDVRGQDTGQLQDRHRHAQHPGQERDQDQPKRSPGSLRACS